MNAILDFFVEKSGGYGVFIWPAYGVTVLMLGGAVIWAIMGWRQAKARLAALEKR